MARVWVQLNRYKPQVAILLPVQNILESRSLQHSSALSLRVRLRLPHPPMWLPDASPALPGVMPVSLDVLSCHLSVYQNDTNFSRPSCNLCYKVSPYRTTG